MRTRGRGLGLIALGLAGAWLCWPTSTIAAGAPHGMETIKQAQKLGLTQVKNCQSCHVDKLPKKGAPVTLNDMGKWLQDQKTVRKAKEMDVAWLKDYVPGK